jgi:outer membrane protein assembly factor BamB
MANTLDLPVAVHQPSLGRRLLPTGILLIGIALLFAVWVWPGNEGDSWRVGKLLTILLATAVLSLMALRPNSRRRKTISLTVLLVIGVPMLFCRPVSMSGNFEPIIVARSWVRAVLLGGSPDAILEKHRQEQGTAGIAADFTEQPGDWPAFRGPNRDGVVSGPKLTRDWSKSPPKEIWRQPVGGGYASFAIANGFLVTIEQRRDEEVVVCYQASTGKEVWTAAWKARFDESLGGPGPRATPTIAHGDVFALGAEGRLVCLNGKDGKEKWAVALLDGNKNVDWAQSGSPLVVDDLVIVNPGAQTAEAGGLAVQAFHRTSGKPVWAAGNHKTGYVSPQLATLGGKRQVLVFDADGLGGHDLASGAELWRFSWATKFGINVAQPIVVGEDSVFICSDYSGDATGGALVKVTEADGKWSTQQVWRTKNTVMRCKFTSPVRRKQAEGDYAYGLDDPGKLECLDLKTGKSVWKDERRPRKGDAFGQGQILLADDLIVVLTEYGELVLVEATPTAFRELGRITALTKGPKTWNTPALAHGRVYVRNEEEMACFDLMGP